MKRRKRPELIELTRERTPRNLRAEAGYLRLEAQRQIYAGCSLLKTADFLDLEADGKEDFEQETKSHTSERA